MLCAGKPAAPPPLRATPPPPASRKHIPTPTSRAPTPPLAPTVGILNPPPPAAPAPTVTKHKKTPALGKGHKKPAVSANIKAPETALEGAKRGGLRSCLVGMLCYGAKRKLPVSALLKMPVVTCNCPDHGSCLHVFAVVFSMRKGLHLCGPVLVPFFVHVQGMLAPVALTSVIRHTQYNVVSSPERTMEHVASISCTQC